MGMIFKTKIDRFGRIVIPKKLRDEFGITDNSEIKIEKTDTNDIIIHPKISKPFVEEKGGVLVACSEPTGSFGNFIEKERENRMKNILKDIEY